MARRSTTSHALKNVGNDPSYRKLKGDYYPVTRSFEIGTQGNCDVMVGDVGQLLSKVNHRLYRQGKTYSIKLDLSPSASAGRYEVYALMDTWYLMKAWQMARSTYLKATADERKQMGSSTARWEDFRVGFGLTLANQVSAEPIGYTGAGTATRYSAGEFVNSQVYLESDGTVREFSFGDGTAAIFGILEEYGRTNNTDDDPVGTTGTTPAYNGVDGEVDGNQRAALGNSGNDAPYNASTMPSAVWVKVAELRNDAPEAAKLSTGFFMAPAGAFYVKPPSGTFTFDNEISITVQSGNYKGVKAHNLGV